MSVMLIRIQADKLDPDPHSKGRTCFYYMEDITKTNCQNYQRNCRKMQKKEEKGKRETGRKEKEEKALNVR